MKIIPILLSTFILFSNIAYAENNEKKKEFRVESGMTGAINSSKAIEPRSLGSEGRFKTWTFYPNSVYKFTGFYMHPTYLEFEEGETVTTVSSPKPNAWQIVPAANRLFLKPIEDNADTTMTVMTSKRVYFFELHAKEASGPFDKDLTFFIKFRYPEYNGEDSIIRYTSSIMPDLSHPEKYNFNYTMTGEDSIAPMKVFDDGEFTYFQFRDKNATLPAIFLVDNQGFEKLTNFRVVGDYVIIESVGAQFTLRNGPDIICIYNENLQRRNKKPLR